MALLLAFAGCGGESEATESATTTTATSPSEIDLEVAPEYEAGKVVASESGCLACHRIGESGNRGPGPDLTEIGSQMSPDAIARAVIEGPGIMPNYEELKSKKPQEFRDLVSFLSSLSTSSG